ncbi:uncharacterized protein LOC116194261 isoform X2 [Punica granatum]|uniref:Uncharacterized protein LOC116194261 isoform X2 n=1 Tax=Punica granatum TaxID=22663 RepID=A0A6P8C8W1_PUNGR|nr:uncharacterized protein LOC116194261 isoform X2 [Punica granatum]
MALPVEEMQRPEINSFTDELGGNALESSLGDHPRVKQAVTQVFASGISGSVRLLIRGTTLIVMFVKTKFIVPIGGNWTSSGGGG